MIGEGKYPESICEELLGYCLAPVCQMGGLGGDNMSIIIICFLHGKPWEELVERCKKIHMDKKAATKLSEPAFSQFDRFTADGPFAEVSVLKASDDVHNTGDSSSSHTSSPSSSPISTEEKFDTMLVEDGEPAKTEEKPVETPVEASEAEKPKEEATPEPPKEEIVSNGD
jgi:protein phosphatase PTC2/3